MSFRRINLIPKRGVDFRKAIEDPANAHVFFLFNDTLDRHDTTEATAGSAAIRPWNHLSENIRSFGISTHSTKLGGGFKNATPEILLIISNHCRQLRKILEKNECTEIWFPADGKGKFATRAGAGVGEEVIDTIMLYLEHYTGPLDGSMV